MAAPRWGPGRAVRAARRVALGLLALVACGSQADLIVPAGGVQALNGGQVDLGCTDLVVGGALSLGSGSIVNARNVTIQSGGVVVANSGSIALGGNWSNAGQFVAGTSTVRLRDTCGSSSAAISGNTTFFNASFVTATGKQYVFATGSTQSIDGLLEIQGSAGLPILFRSSAAGQLAFIDLHNGGTQLIQHVGVSDVWATGQHLAAPLVNEGGTGNDKGWFGNRIGSGGIAPVPSLSTPLLAVLGLLLAALAAFRRRSPGIRTVPTTAQAPARAPAREKSP